jgi:hypothetical protein
LKSFSSHLGVAAAFVVFALWSCSGFSCGGDELPCGWHLRGKCGLWRQCVECNTDGDCDPGAFCSLYGECLDLPQCGAEAGQNCPPGEVCVLDKCELGCEADWDCLGGVGTCLPEGYCEFARCLPEGDCPPGLEPSEGSLACRPACKEGLVHGRCGLAGRCVECASGGICYPATSGILRRICATHDDCAPGLLCVDGVCMQGGFCTIQGECRPSCEPEWEDCPPGEICVGHWCVPECRTDQDCLGGVGTCQEENYCTFEWCQGGSCPEGWEPVEGTLACRLSI